MSYIKHLVNSEGFSAIQVFLEGAHKHIREMGAQIDTPFGKVLGREIQLCLPDGSKYFVDRKALSIFFKTGAAQQGVIRWVIPANEVALRTAHAALCELIREGGDACIPVIRVGAGSTALSCRVRVSGVVHPSAPENVHSVDMSEKQTKSHTITIPVSAVTTVGDKHYVTRWRLRQLLQQRKVIKTGDGWPNTILGGVWLESNDFWENFFVHLIAIAKQVEDADLVQDEQISAKREQEREQRERNQNQALEASKARKLTLKASEERREAQKTKHMNSLETVQAKRVQWGEYVTEKNQYGDKQKKLVTRSAENCTLRFSGQRVYITFPDGNEIYKMRHNVEWSDT